MHGHSHDIFMVQVEEVLFSIFLHNANTCCSENYTTIRRISQIASCVETSETVGPLECQVVVWSLAHDPLELEVVGCAILDLASPDVHAAALVASS